MLGETLRKTREELRLDLKEVSSSLKVHHEYLKAIESDAFEKLPPPVYTKSYIRDYARFLNLDAAPLIDEYTALLMAREEKAQPEPPLEAEKSSTLPRKLLFALLVVTIVAASLYHLPAIKFFSSSQDERKIVSVQKSSSPAAHQEQKVALQETGPPRNITPSGGYILNVVATETTWLRVEMEEGKSEEALMRPGDEREWQSGKGFSLKLGNAGGVRLVLNGKDMGTPGGSGQVMQVRLP